MEKKVLVFSLIMITLFLVGARFLIQKNTLALELAENVLVAGASDDYPPYSFLQNDHLVGFDIDLVGEIAQRMRCKMKLKVMSFNILLLELQRGSIQIGAITKGRELAFSKIIIDPHFIAKLPFTDGGEKYALVVSKKYPELFEKVASVVTELLEDGTVDDLKRKWGLV